MKSIHHSSIPGTALLLFLALFSACAQSTQQTHPPTAGPTQTVTAPQSTAIPSATATASPTPTFSPTPKAAPTRYTSRVILRGVGRPDDLAFDPQGRLLFSDEFDGTISRLNADGSVTRLLTDRAGPEGMVVKSDGTIIFAEQTTNRIMSLAPGASTPTVLRTLPGIPSSANCKDGVDGIAFDSTTDTIIVPDSPTGAVYRMSLNGKTFTLLASGIVRPVGAAVDSQGNIYVADECGGAVWRIASGGKTTRIGGFGMPDDVIPDGYGNLLVIDLQPSIHALIRLNLATGKREILASQGYIEPQGLVIDARGDIYVADDYANMIVKYTPV